MNRKKTKAIEIYPGKYCATPLEEHKSDEENIIAYFECLFGDDITTIKVASFKELEEYCYYHKFTKKFVLDTIKKRIKIKSNMNLETWILVDNGDMFEGTREQFMNCFFSNADDEQIKSWCLKHGYSLQIGEETIVKKKISEVCYKYKDGRFLKFSNMGDGEYQLILTNEITSDCLFTRDWLFSAILSSCDGIYDDSGEYISDALPESDFIIQNSEIKIIE